MYGFAGEDGGLAGRIKALSFGFEYLFYFDEDGVPSAAVDGMFVPVVAIRHGTVIALGGCQQGLSAFFRQVAGDGKVIFRLVRDGRIVRIDGRIGQVFTGLDL